MTKKRQDDLGFLFSRLTWPSLMVRERTCTSIAELLTDKEQASDTMEYLENWAMQQKLESIAVFSLLILLRTKMLCQTFELPSSTKILEMIRKPSALSYLLLKELGYDNVPKLDWSSICLVDAPKDFVPSNFFQKYCTSYLPPMYEMHARNIEKEYHIPFYKHWAFECKTILVSINRKSSPEPLEFWGRPEHEHYGAIDFVLSEVYRSGYLRTLAWAVAKNKLPETEATCLAIETCPIDPSLWKVQSQPKPQWWLTAMPLSGVIDTVVGDIWEKVNALWQKNISIKNGLIIAQSSGRVCETDSIYDLEIRGFFQRCYGNKKQNLEEILKETKCLIPFVTKSTGLDGYIGNEPIDKYAKSFNDWELLPVSCRVWPYTTPRWQFTRLRREIWIPTPFLAKSGFEIKCESDALNIIENKKIIGQWQDWHWNLHEKVNANLTPSTGEYLLIDRSIIDEFTEKEKCRFCWICQIIQYHREHSYEEYKTYSYTKDYGTSNIILT